MERTLLPELLDSLPAEDPAARHSRRDLRVINSLMGNVRWFGRELPRQCAPTTPVLELGAGTGELGLRLHRSGFPVDGLDRAPRPAPWTAARLWIREDLRTFRGYPLYGAVLANLILHHLDADDLGRLGAQLRQGPRLLLASEPVRSRRAQLCFRLLGPLLGVNHVTRHDAHVSIGSGFLGEELPHLLQLDPGCWSWRCHTTTRGAYRMVAWRRS